MDSALSQREHTSLSADSFGLCSRATWHRLGNLHQVDASNEIHFARVDLQDVKSSLFVGVGELYLSVDTAGAEQGIVQNIDSIGCHDDLDVCGRLETIKLVKKLEHSSLHFRITSGALYTLATDGIDFIHENDRRGVLPGHDEKLTDHPSSFTDVFLDEFTTLHSDEATVGVMGNGSCKKSLSSAWRAIEQDSLWLRDTQAVEDLRMLDGQFNDFLDFLDLLLETTNHVVC